MRDFYGVKIKYGDIIELRADGDDRGSAFFRGVVLLDDDGELVVMRRSNYIARGTGNVQYSTRLYILERSNDVVKVRGW